MEALNSELDSVFKPNMGLTGPELEVEVYTKALLRQGAEQFIEHSLQLGGYYD